MSGIKKILIILSITGCVGSLVKAQISPPGLGDANTAFWSAFGVKRNLDSLGKNKP